MWSNWPSAAKVENFRVVGDLSQTFTLASNEFLIAGGNGYRAFAAAKSNSNRLNLLSQIGEQQVLIEYIREALGGIVAIPEPLTAPRIIRSEIIGSRFPSASAESVSFNFLLAAGREFVLQVGSNVVSDWWGGLELLPEEGIIFRASSQDNDDGFVNFTIQLPNNREQAFIRLLLLE